MPHHFIRNMSSPLLSVAPMILSGSRFRAKPRGFSLYTHTNKHRHLVSRAHLITSVDSTALWLYCSVNAHTSVQYFVICRQHAGVRRISLKPCPAGLSLKPQCILHTDATMWTCRETHPFLTKAQTCTSHHSRFIQGLKCKKCV